MRVFRFSTTRSKPLKEAVRNAAATVFVWKHRRRPQTGCIEGAPGQTGGGTEGGAQTCFGHAAIAAEAGLRATASNMWATRPDGTKGAMAALRARDANQL